MEKTMTTNQKVVEALDIAGATMSKMASELDTLRPIHADLHARIPETVRVLEEYGLLTNEAMRKNAAELLTQPEGIHRIIQNLAQKVAESRVGPYEPGEPSEQLSKTAGTAGSDDGDVDPRFRTMVARFGLPAGGKA